MGGGHQLLQLCRPHYGKTTSAPAALQTPLWEKDISSCSSADLTMGGGHQLLQLCRTHYGRTSAPAALQLSLWEDISSCSSADPTMGEGHQLLQFCRPHYGGRTSAPAVLQTTLWGEDISSCSSAEHTMGGHQLLQLCRPHYGRRTSAPAALQTATRDVNGRLQPRPPGPDTGTGRHGPVPPSQHSHIAASRCCTVKTKRSIRKKAPRCFMHKCPWRILAFKLNVNFVCSSESVLFCSDAQVT